MKREKRLYQSYLREFEALQKEGCKLYYPDREVISPKSMAKLMVKDSLGCYMRDPHYDNMGRVVSIRFNRVSTYITPVGEENTNQAKR